MVAAPDQRGQGLSDLSTLDKWDLDTWADDLAALIDELGPHRQAAGLIVASMTPKVSAPEEIARRMESWLERPRNKYGRVRTSSRVLRLRKRCSACVYL